ncbi:MAG: cell wall metabolism sensor histidine kinase WalK [Anaerolineae bacterium]|nr:cell wall metabolism sensor histidine kinase WalK [Anaerolineae bacterium]
MNKTPLLRTYIFSILAALLLTLALIVLVMRPPMNDLAFLAALLAITALASAVAGFVSLRLGWWRRFRSLTATITMAYLLGSVIILFNVWVTARMMFINQHDFVLASLLLLFAGGISVAFGYFLSNSITQTLRDLVQSAEELSDGNFSTRVDIIGNDEVAHLAESFNVMAASLEQAKLAEQTLDAARRDLVAWASHDLRTPLASLRAMLDALADGVVTDEHTVSRYLAQSQAEITRMSALIDDLFELTQLDTGHLELHCEHSSITDLISDTLEALSARAQSKNITLSGKVGAPVGLVWMASDKISRVLHNLIENALRHTPAAGRVEIIAAQDHEFVTVSVRDTGPGVSAEDLPFVFDRFYRGEKSRSRHGFEKGGAGLGLAIAKGIVEAHGGKIWIDSAHGQGTNIHFTLPVSTAK